VKPFEMPTFLRRREPSPEAKAHAARELARIDARPVRILNADASLSPIEQRFSQCFEAARTGIALVAQHPVGHFRVDFAHLATRTVIELDGFDHHSSTADIENDRKRQRYIEDAGWHVIRFGGREVHHDPEACVRAVLRRIHSRTRGR
jgi:very-short-patch-repair endonuclease